MELLDDFEGPCHSYIGVVFTACHRDSQKLFRNRIKYHGWVPAKGLRFGKAKSKENSQKDEDVVEFQWGKGRHEHSAAIYYNKDELKRFGFPNDTQCADESPLRLDVKNAGGFLRNLPENAVERVGRPRTAGNLDDSVYFAPVESFCWGNILIVQLLSVDDTNIRLSVLVTAVKYFRGRSRVEGPVRSTRELKRDLMSNGEVVGKVVQPCAHLRIFHICRVARESERFFIPNCGILCDQIVFEWDWQL